MVPNNSGLGCQITTMDCMVNDIVWQDFGRGEVTQVVLDVRRRRVM